MRRLCGLALLAGIGIGGMPPARAQPSQYVVFFPEWSAVIDGPAHDVIGQAADWAKAHSGSTAEVVGYADPTGSQPANVLLSQLRAQVVADGLTAAGVAAGQIHEVGRGSVQFSGTPVESRRVVIRMTP